MKHKVHLFALVRLQLEDVGAETHEAAVEKATARFHDLYEIFDTKNVRQLPAGIADLEFGEEISHFLVDEAGDPEHERSTWHGARVQHGAGSGGGSTVVKADATEALRLSRLQELNPGAERQELERRYGQVWDPLELAEVFLVVGFMAPFVVVRRKSDGKTGSLEFQHDPRLYFGWKEDR